MEPIVQNAVRDWRRAILSDGMYMNADTIIHALESGDNLDSVVDAIAMEVRQEVQDFHTYKTTGTLPVVEFLDYAIKTTVPVEESFKDVKRALKTGVRTVQKTGPVTFLRRNAMGIKNILRTGGDVLRSGEYEKFQRSLAKTVKECKTVEDVDYLIADRKGAMSTVTQFRKNVNSGKVTVKYDIKKLDAYIKWMKEDYYKMLLRRKNELTKAGKMESADPDTSADDSEFVAIENEAVQKLANAVVIATAECGFNPDQRGLNEITPMDGSRAFCITPWSNAERTVGNALCDICEAETDEELTEAMIHFAQVAEAVNAIYEVAEVDELDDVEESIGSTARGAVRKVRNTTRKVSRTIDRTSRGVKAGAKKTIDPIVKLIDKNIEKIKAADASERREIILKGGIIPKVMRWIKRTIMMMIGAGLSFIVPEAALVTAIAFIGWICTDKYLDGKQRHDILRQLEDEIEIVNEKIDDARGDTNKQKKYELMRIRNKLKRTSDKIRYNLKVNPEEEIVQNLKNKKPNVK